MTPRQPESRPAVSIVLPVYDRLKFLRPAVDSVHAQTFEDWELIIADDGSADLTHAYLRALGQLPRHRMIRLSHTGNPAAVRNAALRAASGDYVAFLDSDDVWAPKKLELQMASLRSRPECGWSYTAFIAVDENLDPLTGARALRSPASGGWILGRLAAMEVTIALPSVVASRELIERVGGFDEGQRMCEDYDLWLRLATQSEIDAVDEPLLLVRRHLEHSGDDIIAFEDMHRVLRKMRRSGVAAELAPILHRRRAMVSAGLARSHAARGDRLSVLRSLASGAPYSWTYPEWWSRAAATIARAFAPAPVRAALRRYRHCGRSPDVPT